jgi:hypothetical protein
VLISLVSVTNAKLQTIRHDKLEEFMLRLAAIGDHETNSGGPLETGSPPPSVPPLEAENSTGNPQQGFTP